MYTDMIYTTACLWLLRTMVLSIPLSENMVTLCTAHGLHFPNNAHQTPGNCEHWFWCLSISTIGGRNVAIQEAKQKMPSE